MMLSERMARLRQLMREHQLPALLITNPIHRTYMTGFTGSAGCALLTWDDAWLLTDFRYKIQAAQQTKNWSVVQHDGDPVGWVQQQLLKRKITQLGFEQEDLTYSDYIAYQQKLKPISFIPTCNLIQKLRIRKDEQEITRLQKAATLADETYEYVLQFIRPGLSEQEVYVEIEMFMRRKGADSSSFPCIVASGYRSAMPHGTATHKIIEKNELITLDFGALLGGYCSDLTRTIATGNVHPRLKDIYHIVLESQLHTLTHLKPGMTGEEVDALARDIITKYGYENHFQHGTGHGLGMEVHESPRLSPRSHEMLEPGMVVTIEPGIYIEGLGGVRIEDDVLLTQDGNVPLTKANKTYTIV